MLTEREAQRAVEILRELELTEYQRYMAGLIKATREQADADGDTPSISYRDALLEAKQRRLKDPTYKTIGQILSEKPDEVARQARLQREADERRATMLRESARHTEEVKANAPTSVNPGEAEVSLVGAVHERPADRPRPSTRPKFDNVLDALTRPTRESRCLNDDSVDTLIERW